jgi:TolB protein
VIRLVSTVIAVFAVAILAAGSPSAARQPDTLAYVSTLTGALTLTTNGLVQRPLLRAKKVSSFEWSPNGRRLAFISSGELHVVNADGSGVRRLRAKPIDGRIAWSPDGRRIAFTGTGGGSLQIFILGVDGGGSKVLTSSVSAPVLPSWSPTGSTIAFTSANTNFGHIYTVRADGTGLRKLTDGRHESFPSWSPDGRLILFQPYTCPGGKCGYGISVMDADGSHQRRLAHVPRAPGGGGLHASWSPDSRRIAFLRRRDQSVGSDILVVGVQDRRLRRVATDSRSFSLPAWSPDGRRIAYASGYGKGISITVMNADGSAKRPFVQFAVSPAYQPTR